MCMYPKVKPADVDSRMLAVVRTIVLVVWLLSLAGLLFLFGYIRLHGATPDRTILAVDLGKICGGFFAVWAVMTWKARRKQT